MSDAKKIEEGRSLFSAEESELLEGVGQTFQQEDPLAELDMELLEPGGEKRPPAYKDTRYQGAVLAGVLLLGMLGLAKFVLQGADASSSELAPQDSQAQAYKAEADRYRNEVEQQRGENAHLTQGAQFQSVPMTPSKPPQVPGRTQPTPTQNKPTAVASRPAATPKRVKPRNTVSLSRYRPKPPSFPKVSNPPRRAKPQVSKPKAPSLGECAEFIQTGLVVPACSKYGISEKKEVAQAPVTLPRSPQPVTSRPPINLQPYKPPTKTAYAPKTVRKPKPSYKVNYLAGEIQTVDQYEQEINSSSSGVATVQKVAMKAKVADLIEWDSAQTAQEVVIPLKITSGSRKGQMAEAKITKLNGLQFTAHLISLNNEPVEPDAFELRRKGTRYLRAEIKRHGGTSFKDRVVAAGLGIAGEAVSNELAGVRGGNHISSLVPRGGSQNGGQVSQTWRFDGGVDIVPK